MQRRAQCFCNHPTQHTARHCKYPLTSDFNLSGRNRFTVHYQDPWWIGASFGDALVAAHRTRLHMCCSLQRVTLCTHSPERVIYGSALCWHYQLLSGGFDQFVRSTRHSRLAAHRVCARACLSTVNQCTLLARCIFFAYSDRARGLSIGTLLRVQRFASLKGAPTACFSYIFVLAQICHRGR